MAGGQQLRLLLWKDYITRKRNVITLAGIVWATAVMCSLYIVRVNISNEDHPTCGFPARALPSAGVVPFLQSFLCTINNECSPLDHYDELPTYDNSKLTQLQRKLAPVLNETVLDLATSVPDAIRILATLADVVDQPTFLDISKNGLKVKDLFTKPVRVKRFLSSRLRLNAEEADSLMDAELSLQGLLKGDLNGCSASLNQTLLLDGHLEGVVEKLCGVSMEEGLKILMEMVSEVDLNKYTHMLGDMYYKLTGDNRLSTVGELLTAVLRMMRLQNFLPPELMSIFRGQTVDFSYVHLDLIRKLVDLFKPTFGNTDTYQTVSGVTDAMTVGLQYLDKLFAKQRMQDEEKNITNVGDNNGLKSVSNVFHNAVDLLHESVGKNTSIDTFNILSQIMGFITKFLPTSTKHDVLFYSTLLAKLMESAHKVISVNMHIEQLTYNATLRHPDAVKVLLDLSPRLVAKAFDALADAERVQLLTSKINSSGQMFCDAYKIQTFFVITRSEADSLKKDLCTDVWKRYVTDLVHTFAVNEVRKNINNMASLLIQETLGKDTSDQLYSLDQDFKVLKNFTNSLIRMEEEPKVEVDWSKLFQGKTADELMRVVKEKAELGKQMLIVIHGALAKEIVNQNPILNIKISPYLDDVITLVSAINEQLEKTPRNVTDNLKVLYPKIVEAMLNTALDEEKTYRALSTPGAAMFCRGVETAAEYVQLPADEQQMFVETLCDATVAIDRGLMNDSAVSVAINNIKKSGHFIMELNWNKLITNLKKLYIKLDRDYTYLFKFTYYGMDDGVKAEMDVLFNKAKQFWFGDENMERSIHLSVKLCARALDVLDRGLFGAGGEAWARAKLAATSAVGPLAVLHDVVQLLDGLLRNDTLVYTGGLPPRTVEALTKIVPNLPQLMVDAVDVIVRGDTDVEPIISLLNASPPWPCRGGLAPSLRLPARAHAAVEGLETLLCMDADMQTEWKDYLDANNASLKNMKPWNATIFPPHVFLRLSSAVDSLIADVSLIRNATAYVFGEATDGRFGVRQAWDYAVDKLNTTERDDVFRNMFNKIDSVLTAMNTSSPAGDVSVHTVWERYSNCSSPAAACHELGRRAWKYFFEGFSVILEHIATDLLTYFKEVNEPNSNLLQLLGFTRSTGLYVLYDKAAEFMGVLLNSYWDFGFMSQVRRATLFEFWDCDEVVSALVPAPGSAIDSAAIKRVQPFVCPSLLHWISLPRGDNTLLDVVSKPQYYFFTIPVQNLTSRYESAFNKATELAAYLTDISKTNRTILSKDAVDMNTIQDKLNTIVDQVFNFKIEANDPKYEEFRDINTKSFIANVYLTRIVTIVNKLQENIANIDVNAISNDDNKKEMEADLKIIQYLFKRKPIEAIAIHFDLITDVVFDMRDNYNLVDAFDKLCSDVKVNTTKKILRSNDAIVSQLCNKRYKEVYGVVQEAVLKDYVDAANTLHRLVKMLQSGDSDEVTDIFEFLSSRKQLITSLRTSIKYSYELSIPIYLKYLQSNAQSYRVILSFLSGGDWWGELTKLYQGPYATKFWGHLENSLQIAEDWLTKFDEIHLVRLLHEVGTNDTEQFCLPNITLSDYLPDSTGMLSDVKRQMCQSDKTELYREIPPLLYAAQGYENSLKVSKDVDYASIESDLSSVESLLPGARAPVAPRPPRWATEPRLAHLATVAKNVLSKESLTKAAFAVLTNVVDAATLYLNNSQCTACSELTTWFKQLSLQLFKKQEYEALLCHVHDTSADLLYQALHHDFHWDMAVKELLSSRNYTKHEMNRSLNQFLSQVRGHLLEDMAANSSRLADCLAANVTRNELGNVTLLASVFAHTLTLLRSALPHLHEVPGVRQVPYLKELSAVVAPTLDVLTPLGQLLNDKADLHHDLHHCIDRHDVVFYVQDGSVNLRNILSSEPITAYLTPSAGDWGDICNHYDCRCIDEVVRRNVNTTHIQLILPGRQLEEFWRFTFITNILHHVERLVLHCARALGEASRLRLRALARGELSALIDAGLVMLNDDVLDTVIFSLQGIATEVRPLLNGTELQHDLEVLPSGLQVLKHFKHYLLNEVDLKLPVGALFPGAEALEAALGALGVNNTNFWSLAAYRIRAGHIDLAPLLTSKLEDSHISSYVCELDAMGQVIQPGDLHVVTADDVLAAVAEQFCPLTDQQAKSLLPAIMRGFNYTIVVDKVVDVLLSKLYSASNVSQTDGERARARAPALAALLPALRDQLTDVKALLADEPMFEALQDFSSVGNLLSSPAFLSSAGSVLCGKPLAMNTNRFYKSIAASPDFSTGPDPRQLDVLPTDFCRSLYSDIARMEGGKIVWSFVKPLVMGKILYTPPTPAVTRIIHKANETFAPMIKMSHLVQSLGAAAPALTQLASRGAGLAALGRLAALAPGAVPAVNLEGLLDQVADVKGISGLLQKGSELLRCINLDRFQPSPDEQQMTHDAAKLSLVNEFSAGLVFLNVEQQAETLRNVHYKIRMDIDNAPTTAKLKDYLWIPGPEANFIENMRYFRGFVQIQDIVGKAIIHLSSNSTRHKRETRDIMPSNSIRDKRETRNIMPSDSIRAKRESREIEDGVRDDFAIYTQQTPYPCYRKDYFQTSLYDSQSLIVAFFFSLLFTVASAVRFIVVDKETGNTMLMSVMGVDLRWHTLSWFVTSLAEVSATCACVTLVLRYGRVLPTTDPTLVFALLFIFGVSVLSFCYMLSKLFTSASLAAVCGAIAYLMSFMPFIIILSLEAVLYSQLKMLVCLSMSSSLCYAFLYITRLEARGAGAGWGDVWRASDASDVSIAAPAAMIVLDAVLYAAVGYLLDRYYGEKRVTSNITHAAGDKAGVSIVRVSKSYGNTLALRGVSMELRAGEITTLLGHNGAGKTTLINILTGTTRASGGHVVVRGGGAGGDARAGLCPQQDVLYEHLTPAEHVRLYAMLKTGKPLEEVRDEVEELERALGLGPVLDTRASRLSGGTRRRLSVALAFAGAARLVALDEPTARVDPPARRDIWSMIAKLKEGRTILITTHHLDEAEMLSDQIVIMHKGQIHTMGSPIEIKRSLGTGYKLTVTYPALAADLDEPWDQPSLQESSKQLLSAVRAAVPNANLLDASGTDVEINVPFYDVNGVNNNFVQLCTTLESSQSALGFRSYSLDCSSLEQVFYNVCQEGDTLPAVDTASEGTTSKSASTSSVKTDRVSGLLPLDGPLTGTAMEQLLAMLHVRLLHHMRNSWLLFLLVALPTIFVVTAMAFSTLRPPADGEAPLLLDQRLYANATQFIVPKPSIYSNVTDPAFAERVLRHLTEGLLVQNWTAADTPTCQCTDTQQVCEATQNGTLALPEMMSLPDVHALNQWLVNTQQMYIEKRYGGYSSAVSDGGTALTAWYNNKGHHSLVCHVAAIHSALLASLTDSTANITVYSHPLKISKEQISKATVYQHIADAGIAGLVLVAYCLVSGGAAIYLVGARTSQQKRLQLLSGVSPALYWAAALAWDMMIIFVNMCITACVMCAFGFPVFVDRSNLPAICALILLYGFACGNLVHVCEKMFAEASVANMVLFCGNAFLGLALITVLLILDIISDSDATDHARWVLHKIFLIAPQFALGDGLLEIAKNTIQAQVLSRFGMDTYRDPLHSALVLPHAAALLLVGLLLLLLNLAIEYDCFDYLLTRYRRHAAAAALAGAGAEPCAEARAECERVALLRASSQHAPLRVNTLGNINRGYVHSECKKRSLQRAVHPEGDVAQCARLWRLYQGTPALRGLTLGVPPGQCTALLGQNGAGKSTTFSLLTGQLRPSAGTIYLRGETAHAAQLRTGLISYCPQTDAIDPLLTVRETLEFYCKLRGIDQREEVVSRALAQCDLRAYSAVLARALSGGTRRKLCAALAFMSRASLVLLDEPTSGMDPVARASVSRGVRGACGDGRGVLLATHALDDARALASRVALLNGMDPVARASVSRGVRGACGDGRGVLLATHALDDARALASRVALLKGGSLLALAGLDDCLSRFGGGYVIACRALKPRAVWTCVHTRVPHATLKALHLTSLQFLIPVRATVGGKEVSTSLSAMFRLMAELQTSCDVDDFTLNQSSLEEMFLSFSEPRAAASASPPAQLSPDELLSVTSL